MGRHWTIAVVLAACGLASGAAAQPRRIYVANDTHNSLMWNANIPDTQAAYLAMTDYYLDQMDATATADPRWRSKFFMDSAYWLYTIDRATDPAAATRRARVEQRLRDGSFTVAANTVIPTFGGMSAEMVLRSMYYAGAWERRVGGGYRVRIANHMENQVHPWGVASLWAGCGVKYSWKGVCDCVTRLPGSGNRELPIYYQTGPDGQRVLVKWYPLMGSNQSIGGYSEAFSIPGAVAALDSVFSAGQFPNGSAYPYQVAGAFGRGWDFLTNFTTEFVTQPPMLTTTAREVVTSNVQDFFEDFEARYGPQVPSQSVSFGNEWDTYPASLQEVAAGHRRAVDKLRSAEALAVVASILNPNFMNGRDAARSEANVAIALSRDHDWTADGAISRAQWAQYQRDNLATIRSYVDTLQDDAIAAISRDVPASASGNPRFWVFNPPGSWSRTDAADLPAPPFAPPFHVIEVESGAEVPSQSVVVDGQAKVRIWATSVPTVGYKTYEIVPGAGQVFAGAPTAQLIDASTGRLTNDAYIVTLSGRGAITSLLLQGSLQQFAAQTGLQLNDLGPGSGAVTIENAGPVSATLVASATGPLARTVRVTVYRPTTAVYQRIDIENRITQNFTDVREIAFGFEPLSPSSPQSLHWHEEVGGIGIADTTGPGIYSTRQARYDYLTFNNFVAGQLGGANKQYLLANADSLFFRLGNSTVSTPDFKSPLVRALLGGQIDGPNLGIPAQGGDSLFIQRYALVAGGSSGSDLAAAMSIALDMKQPLIVGPALGSASSRLPGARYSLIAGSPSVMTWSLKPAEEGWFSPDGPITLRVWNMNERIAQPVPPTSFTVQFPGSPVTRIVSSTHLETIDPSITPTPTLAAGQGTIALARQQLRTVRVATTATCPANCDLSTTPPILNALDFSCFLERYRTVLGLSADLQQRDYANCDGSTVSPVLNALDFACFLERYRAGCL